MVFPISDVDAAFVIRGDGMRGVELHCLFSSQSPRSLKLTEFIEKKPPPIDGSVGNYDRTVWQDDSVRREIEPIGGTVDLQQAGTILIEFENTFQTGVHDPNAPPGICRDLVGQHEKVGPPGGLHPARLRIEHKDGRFPDELLEEAGLRVHVIFTVMKSKEASIGRQRYARELVACERISVGKQGPFAVERVGVCLGGSPVPRHPSSEGKSTDCQEITA
jgi:hypothetical protein